ncbi:MAG: heavy metal-binding domain-containing protein [Cellulosilyticaceae bacterium]
MLVVNVDYVSDKELEVLGLVEGIASGERLEGVTTKAVEVMQQAAKKVKADAIVNARFNTIVTSTGIQVLAYGTAVKYHITYDLQQF